MREAAPRFTNSSPMTAPLLPGYAESGYTERKKDRTQNKVIGNPGDACAEERKGGEQSKVARRLGVHSRPWVEGSAHLARSAKVLRWCAARLLLRTLTGEFAFRRTLRIDVRALPIRIEHQSRGIAASTPLPPLADWLAVTKAQD